MEPLTAIDAVRKRPGMYVGNTGDGSGVVHLVLEVLANAYDQYLVGRCTTIAIEVAADGTIAIEDDGPGLVVDDHLLTTQSHRPTVDGHRPHAHLGLGGLGLFVVNALSERFELRTVRDGAETTAVCAHGRSIEPITTVPRDRASGTTVTFRPDPEIFLHTRVPRVALTEHLEDLAFLSPGLRLRWSFGGDDLATRGIAARVAIAASCPISEIAHHRATYETATGPIVVEVALAWRTVRHLGDRDPRIDSFVNLGRTRGGGVHVAGLLAGVHSFVEVRPAEDAQLGLVATVAVILADVLFGSPTKEKLISPAVRAPVAEATVAALEAWAQAHPAAAAALRTRTFRSGRAVE